jgi:prepilin-type N-terminal cleavage/methylation domain-containing protein
MKKLGFTLAEVLITLVIIGVIAAMTVPTLMNNTNAQEFRSALKKAISGVNQALTLNYALEGLSAQDYSTAATLVSGIFKTRMSVIDGATGFTVNNVCNGASSDTVFTTADGMVFCVSSEYTSANSDDESSKCNSYNTVPCSLDATKPTLWIDVNGAKKPNTVTTSSSRPKDIYQAQIYAQKVVPWNTPTQEVMFDKGTDNSAS